MLDIPKVLFLSCLGSYFYSIAQEYYKGETNPLLYYLWGSHLEFVSIDINRNRRSEGGNPWRYQPVVIMNNQRETKIDVHFWDYLKDTLNIQVKKNVIVNEGLILDKIISAINGGLYCICKVDEYHISHSKFYMTKSNRHYLLIKSMDILNKVFTVIDSETTSIYPVKFSELERAMVDNDFNSKLAYFVSNKDIRLEEMICELTQEIEISSNRSYIIKMKENLNNVTYDNMEYCLRGYHYNIISKIIPVLESQKIFFRQIGDEDNIQQINQLLCLWRELNIFILYKIGRKNIDLNGLKKKLLDIYNFV